MELAICSYSFHRLLAAGQQDILRYIADCRELGCTQLDPWNGHLAPVLPKEATGPLTPQRGTLRLVGRDLRAWNAAERARTVADVPQEAPLEDEFRVHEIVDMCRSPDQGLL